MGETRETDEPEECDPKPLNLINYLVEKVRGLETENKKLRTSEGRLRTYLERQLSDLEDTEREAQSIRDLLYPDVEEIADGK